MCGQQDLPCLWVLLAFEVGLLSWGLIEGAWVLGPEMVGFLVVPLLGWTCLRSTGTQEDRVGSERGALQCGRWNGITAMVGRLQERTGNSDGGWLPTFSHCP